MVSYSTLRNVAVTLAFVLVALPAVWGSDEEPALPAGMTPTEEDEPSLPAGAAEEEEPALPLGPAEAVRALDEGEPLLLRLREGLPFQLGGFWETRVGVRLRDDPYERDLSIAETRLQLEIEKAWPSATLKLKSDFIYDGVAGEHRVKLEQGRGWLDLREAHVSFSPMAFMDVRAGRQVLTWGTGDLIFVNDMFPKDWNSFFIGRDTEYLKAPSDALKVALFSDVANLDIVYMPRFDADRFVDGRRVSYYSGTLGRRAGRDAIVKVERPHDWFEDYELALRLHRLVGSYELAAYAYRGYWKSPGGMNPITGKATFPKLSVYGASVLGPVGKGIGNVEVGYYDSREDRGGANPFANNSEVRLLVGYEREIARELTMGVQYYLEHMLDYGDYRRALPAGAKRRDRDRHVLTLRLTQLLMNQNLRLSMFAYLSPSDADAYLRPHASYNISDSWTAELGGNVFLGDEPHTFFGQFTRNSNLYAGVRYSF